MIEPMENGVRLPRLLDKNLKEKGRLHPVDGSISGAMKPISTASMTLPKDEWANVHDYVELFTQKGSAGIYRVASCSRTYTGESTVELEHGICVLGDGVMAGEGKLEGAFDDVAREMLSNQVTQANGESMWVLGDAPETDAEYEHEYTNILTGFIDAVEALDGYMMEFDQSGFPWIVHVRAMPAAHTCEGRLARNIENVSIDLDDSDFCTRVYCDNLEGDTKHIDGPTIDDYGVICKTISAADNVTQESLRDYIERYLEDHKHPTASIEINAVDLSEITGEEIDSFGMGMICRLALPDYDVAIDERIVAMNWPNVYGEPQRVRLSLCNRVRDTAQNFVLLKNSATGGTRHNSAGTGRYGGGTGLNTQSLLQMLWQEEKVVENNTARISAAGIKLNPQEVELVATKSALDTVSGVVSDHSASIKVNADEIALKVSKNGVISAINQTAETITISASRIDLSGYVTASEFNTIVGTAGTLTTGALTASSIQVQNLTATNSVKLKGSSVNGWETITFVKSVSLKKEFFDVPATNGATYHVLGSVEVAFSTDSIKVPYN